MILCSLQLAPSSRFAGVRVRHGPKCELVGTPAPRRFHNQAATALLAWLSATERYRQSEGELNATSEGCGSNVMRTVCSSFHGDIRAVGELSGSWHAAHA